MSVQSQIDRLAGAKTTLGNYLQQNGVAVPSGATLDEMALQLADVIEKQNKITAAGILKGDGAGGVSKAAAGTDYAEPAKSYSKTLSSSGWTQDSTTGMYKQVVSISGVTASTPCIVVDVELPTNDADGRNAILAAWNAGPAVNEAVQGSGIVTFYSDAAPTVNIPIRLGVM